MDKKAKHKAIKNKKKNRSKIRIVLLLIIILIIFIVTKSILNKSHAEEISELSEEELKEDIKEVVSANVQVEDNSIEDYYKIYEYKQSESESLKVFEVLDVDVNVKTYIEDVMLENGLSEEDFGFFYYNIDKQNGYFYNEDTWFTAGSTIKVALAMMYYDKINAGEITENTTYKYSSSDYEEGDGLTSYTYSVGSNVPLSFLLEQMIVNSDNTATNILISGLR